MRTMNSKKIGVIILSVFCALCFAIASAPLWKAQAAEVEATGKVELYQLAPGDILSEGYVIKTGNDKLVVIDGGASNGGNEAYLDKALTAIAGTENYTVDTWFLSHAHSDHIYELAKMLNSETINFTVENFVFDFPNFVQSGSNWVADFQSVCSLGSDAPAWNALKTGLDNYAAKKGLTVNGASYYDELNGKVVNSAALKDGPMTISVDDVDFEILQTFSTSDTQVNSNSMVLRAWVDGQSVLFLNDATVESGNRLIGTYGREFLKSDIVQMAHHGQNGTARNVYDAADAKVRLWPNFSQIWTGESYQTGEVRTWVGLPEKVEDFKPSEYDIVAALAKNPSDLYSVSAWNEVLDGMKINLPYLPAYENKFEMKEGASIRLTAGSTGIRFGAELASYDPSATYGFVIAPRAWFNSLGVTENYTAALIAQKGEENIIKLESNVLSDGYHFYINGSVANILDKNIRLKFTGMAYCYKDGVYTDAYTGSLDDITRSVTDVATAAYNFNAFTEEVFDTDDLKIIQGFVNKATGGAPTLSFESNAVSLNTYEDKQLTVTGNVNTNYAKWTSNNESVAKVEDGVVYAYGEGQATITVESMGMTASTTVNVTNEEDAVLSFSGKASEVVASEVSSDIRASRVAGLVETEWLESYSGANGVLKVTSKAQSYDPCVADIRIELPVAITSGVTVRYLIEDTDAKYIYFYDADDATLHGGAGNTYPDIKIITTSGMSYSDLGVWKTVYVPFTSVTTDNKALNILIQGGSSCYEHVIYFDIIENGNTTANYDAIEPYAGIMDTLSGKLTGKYLADFSEEAYRKLIISSTYGGNYIAEKIETEYLKTFDGAKNVMKVTTHNNSNGSGFGDFTVVLPKAMGSNGYTIRFMLAESTSTTKVIRLMNPRTATRIGSDYSWNLGIWQEVHVNYTGNYKNEVTFEIFGGSSGVNVFYIDYIADGNCVAEMQEARKEEQLGILAENLTGNYLADFSNSGYESIAEYATYSEKNSVYKAASINAEYVQAMGAETNLLKVTTVNTSGGRGGFALRLPKEIGSDGFTVRFMIESTGSTIFRMLYPYTEVAKYYEKHNSGSTALTGIIGKWQTVYVKAYTTAPAVDGRTAEDQLNYVEFQFITGANATNVIYIDYVAAGDCAAEMAAAKREEAAATLVSGLADGELANFSSAGYEALVGNQLYSTIGAGDSSYYAASSIVAEQLDTFGAETNVLKISATTTNGGFSLRLPKAIGAEGFTIRFMIEQMSATTTIFQILNPYTFASKANASCELVNTGVTNAIGKWLTVYVSGYAASSYDDIYNYVDFRTYTNTSSTKVIYIDEILVGNQVEAMENRTDRNLTAAIRESLAGNLTDNYLADFSSSDYASLAFARNGANRAAASVTAEKMDLYEGESNVLKVTTTNSGSVGDLKLLLPKASTTGKITVKIWVESACPSVWFLQPNTNNGAYLEDGRTVSFIKNGTAVDNTGSWQTMTLYYNNIAIRDQLDIIFAGGTSGATNTIYIAYVIDGAGEEAPASALFNGNEGFILFADKPPQGDTLRIKDYADAGFTHYVITEDQKSLFAKDSTTGEYLLDDNGNYILNTAYLTFINNAINAELQIIMRNMGNKPDYFDNLTAEQIATLQALIDAYYMCDEPSNTYKPSYKASTYIEALTSLVDWYNANGKDENGDYTLFHVNLLQSYGIEDLVHKGEGITFEQYVNNYVETILKNVNGTKTISTDYYALSTDGSDNYIKSDFIRNLYVIANAAKTLKAEGHDVITNFCVQLCDDAGLDLRLMESINDVRFQTALYAAFGATSFEYYGYLSYMYDQNNLQKYDTYDYVKTVNSELQVLAKAISLFDWNGYKFISKGNNTVTNISGTELSAFSGLSGVTSTADAVVSEFKHGNEYAYMAVNYTEPSDNISNTLTFNFSGETTATVIINGVRSDVELVNGTYTVTLGAGDSVFVYAYGA